MLNGSTLERVYRKSSDLERVLFIPKFSEDREDDLEDSSFVKFLNDMVDKQSDISESEDYELHKVEVRLSRLEKQIRLMPLLKTYILRERELERKIKELESRVQQLESQSRKVIVIEQVSKEQTLSLVESYFKEHGIADIEDLMLNLKLPIEDIIDAIDELKQKGKLEKAEE